MSTDGHGKRNIDILARKLAEIIVRPKGDKKSKLSKLKTIQAKNKEGDWLRRQHKQPFLSRLWARTIITASPYARRSFERSEIRTLLSGKET